MAWVPSGIGTNISQQNLAVMIKVSHSTIQKELLKLQQARLVKVTHRSWVADPTSRVQRTKNLVSASPQLMQGCGERRQRGGKGRQKIARYQREISSEAYDGLPASESMGAAESKRREEESGRGAVVGPASGSKRET